MNSKSLILLFVLFLGSQLFSQTCCSGGVPLSNNLGLSNEGKGTSQIGVNYDYNNLNTLKADKSKLNDNSRQRITNSILLSTGYAFTDKFFIETLFTWVNQTRTISQFGNENFTETSGIGDAIVLLKYAFPKILGNNTTLNVGFGTKVPLGKSDLKSEQGIQLTADLQPGSGAWDAIGWLSISKKLSFRPSASASGSFTYRATGVNNSYLNSLSTYEFGSVIQTNIGYVDQLLILNTIINPGIVFKYRKSLNDRIDNSEIPNTGGEWVFTRAEIGIQFSQKLSFITKLEVPLYSYVEGTQLTPTTRFTTGITYKFNTKKNNLINL